jgi:hypothetical protein
VLLEPLIEVAASGLVTCRRMTYLTLSLSRPFTASLLALFDPTDNLDSVCALCQPKKWVVNERGMPISSYGNPDAAGPK